jgi:hypothetical protein
MKTKKIGNNKFKRSRNKGKRSSSDEEKEEDQKGRKRTFSSALSKFASYVATGNPRSESEEENEENKENYMPEPENLATSSSRQSLPRQSLPRQAKNTTEGSLNEDKMFSSNSNSNSNSRSKKNVQKQLPLVGILSPIEEEPKSSKASATKVPAPKMPAPRTATPKTAAPRTATPKTAAPRTKTATATTECVGPLCKGQTHGLKVETWVADILACVDFKLPPTNGNYDIPEDCLHPQFKHLGPVQVKTVTVELKQNGSYTEKPIGFADAARYVEDSKFDKAKTSIIVYVAQINETTKKIVGVKQINGNLLHNLFKNNKKDWSFIEKGVKETGTLSREYKQEAKSGHVEKALEIKDVIAEKTADVNSFLNERKVGLSLAYKLSEATNPEQKSSRTPQFWSNSELKKSGNLRDSVLSINDFTNTEIHSTKRSRTGSGLDKTVDKEILIQIVSFLSKKQVCNKTKRNNNNNNKTRRKNKSKSEIKL